MSRKKQEDDKLKSDDVDKSASPTSGTKRKKKRRHKSKSSNKAQMGVGNDQQFVDNGQPNYEEPNEPDMNPGM